MINLTEVKDYLDILQEDTDKDQLLQFLINSSTAFIESYTNTSFSIKTFEETKLINSRFIFVNNYPLVEVESIKRREQKEFVEIEDKGEIVADTIMASNGFFWNYKIKYKAWYASVPEDVKLACLMLVWYFFENDPGIKREWISQITTEFLQNIPESILTILFKYKNPKCVT